MKKLVRHYAYVVLIIIRSSFAEIIANFFFLQHHNVIIMWKQIYEIPLKNAVNFITEVTKFPYYKDKFFFTSTHPIYF